MPLYRYVIQRQEYDDHEGEFVFKATVPIAICKTFEKAEKFLKEYDQAFFEGIEAWANLGFEYREGVDVSLCFHPRYYVESYDIRQLQLDDTEKVGWYYLRKIEYWKQSKEGKVFLKDTFPYLGEAYEIRKVEYWNE